MYKATSKEVKRLQALGKVDIVVSKLMSQTKIQPQLHYLASNSPASANWSWQIGLVQLNGEVYELLTRFGCVEGGRKVYLIGYQI